MGVWTEPCQCLTYALFSDHKQQFVAEQIKNYSIVPDENSDWELEYSDFKLNLEQMV